MIFKINLVASFLVIIIFKSLIEAIQNVHNIESQILPAINTSLFNKSTRCKLMVTKFDNQTEYIHPFDAVEVNLNGKTFYYISAWDKIALLDENFTFVNDIDFPNYKQGLFIESIDDMLVMTDFDDEVFVNPDKFISKFDFSLKLLDTVSLSGSGAGLFYDKLSEILYVSDFLNDKVYLFNKNMTKVIDSITVVNPWYALALHGKIFVSSINSITIIDAKTKKILNVLDDLCENSGDIILKFSIDVNENIVYPCLYWSDFRLINSNGTKLGEPIPLGNQFDTEGPFGIVLDSTGKIIVLENEAIEIFY